MTYRCPRCASDDLCVEVPVVVTMDGAGDLTLESFDDVEGSIENLTGIGLVACMNEDCEYSGELRDFDSEPAPDDPITVLRDLLEWAGRLGGWDADVWKRARAVVTASILEG